jgi:cytochrome c-type protein NapB
MRLLARAVVLLTTLTNVTDAERSAALRQRETRRAFDGAPPVVPHPINQESSAACLACHGPGLAIKDRVASKISHAHYGNCTQCHVPAQSGLGLTTDPALLAALADNVFSGAVAPAKGVRASVGAPPTIPHSTLLRSDCNSCHGPAGLFGLRTPHPDRQSCVQCHVPNAELDQRKLLGSITP